MQTRSLSDRQASLARALTRPETYLGAPERMSEHLDVMGVDPKRLRVLGRLTHGKRLDKIANTLPITVRLIGARFEEFGIVFANMYSPRSATRQDNAEQFQHFLRHEFAPSAPVPYLLDVAVFELALSRARQRVETSEKTGSAGPIDDVRRHSPIELCVLAWDVRPLFIDSLAQEAISERALHLAIVGWVGQPSPRVYDLPRPTYDLIASLDDWCSVRDASDSERRLIEGLCRRGILDRRSCASA
jgi:hypothetical protein